jgi:hypothetical protein
LIVSGCKEGPEGGHALGKRVVVDQFQIRRRARRNPVDVFRRGFCGVPDKRLAPPAVPTTPRKRDG